MKGIRELFNTRHWYIAFPMITVGCIIYALGFSIFILPNHISPGGVSGIALIINKFLPFLSTGAVIILLNIPLMILGLIKLGKKSIVRTAYAVVVSSILIDAFEMYLIKYTADTLLSAVAGGVLIGVGIALIMLFGATTGGVDIIVRVLNQKFQHLSYGNLFLIIDTIVVLLTAVTFNNYEIALYSVFTIFCSSFALDKLCYGSDGGKLVYVVTKKHTELTNEIMRVSDRGVTVLEAKGGYSGDDIKVLMCAVRRYEISYVNNAIKKVDPDAFVIVTDSNQINGFGFTR